MISGSIKIHKEPERVAKSYNNIYQYMYDDDYTQDYGNAFGPSDWKEREKLLQSTIKEGKDRGLIRGATVKRTAEFGDTGTIVHIHETWTMAWNYSSQTVEPFKVTWENNGVSHQTGTFDYHPSALILVTESQHEVIEHETIPDLHQSC